MNPVIVYPQGSPARAYLIDKAAVVMGTMPNGKLGQICLNAIDIRHLQAGQFSNIEGRQFPTFCQYAAYGAHTELDPLARGIWPDAAKAILSLENGLRTSPLWPRKDCELGRPAEPEPDPWPLAIAWAWSAWQNQHRRGEKWPMKRRFDEIKIHGYPASFGAFRQVCSRLNLLVTESRPHL